MGKVLPDKTHKPTSENCINSPKHTKSYKFPRAVTKSLKYILILTSFLVYLTLIPIFLLLISPLYLYRYLVIKSAKIFRPDLLKIVCTRDAVVGLDDVTKKCECMLQIMLTYHGTPDIDLIRTIFQKKIMEVKNPRGQFVYEKFTHYYESWLGFAFWKQEEDFNLSEHVRFFDDGEQANEEDINGNNNNNNNSDKPEYITEDELMRRLGPVNTRPFPKGVSPWEILIVPNYIPKVGKIHTDHVPTTDIRDEATLKGDGKMFTLIIRVHHAISDGYCIMKLIMSNMGDEPINKVPSSPPRKISRMQSIMMNLGILFLSPYYHLKQFVLDVDRNFWHMRESKLAKERMTIMSEKIPMQTIKDVGAAQGVSTTAVLLTGFGGAVKRYLEETGQSENIPEVMRALAPMAWKNHPMDSLVNHWTLGFMVLPTGSECAYTRLKLAEKSIQILKRSPILITNFFTVPMLLSAPNWLTDIWATNWMTTMILSNFAGPNFMTKNLENYYVDDVAFWLPLMRGTASLGVAFLSHNGGIRINTVIDKAIIPNDDKAAQLSECINKEFAYLKGLATTQELIV